MDAPRVVDAAIITILPEALRAVRVIFGLDQFEVRGGYEWQWGTVNGRKGPVSVVAGIPLDRENIAASTFTGALLRSWSPRHLLLVDIGGAVEGRDDVQLGDVVTHTHLYYYDFKKELEDGAHSPRILPHAAPSTRLRELSRWPSLRGDASWINSIGTARPVEGNPKVIPGEMLVGGTLFAGSESLLRLLEEHPKVLAVEMEGVGVARAVLDWSAEGEVPEFLVVRGMSDFCNVAPDLNQSARDSWKQYAAEAAAAHAFAIMEGVEPVVSEENEGREWHPGGDQVVDNLWESWLPRLTGREDELEAVLAAFGEDLRESDQGRRHAICGEAGVGKSALARCAVEAIASRYTIRWWIDAEDHLAIRAGLRGLARQLGVFSVDADATEGEAGETPRYLPDLRDFLSNLGQGKRALIVLDNVDDAELKNSIWRVALRYFPGSTCD